MITLNIHPNATVTIFVGSDGEVSITVEPP